MNLHNKSNSEKNENYTKEVLNEQSFNDEKP